MASLLAGCVFGDGLGAFRDCVLGQLSGQQEPDCSLDLPAADGRPLVVLGEAGRLGGNALEKIVDEGVHDGHGLAGDASVGVDLLEDLVDVHGVGLLALLLLLLVALLNTLLGLAGLLNGFSGGFRGHGEFSADASNQRVRT